MCQVSDTVCVIVVSGMCQGNIQGICTLTYNELKCFIINEHLSITDFNFFVLVIKYNTYKIGLQNIILVMYI